MSKLLQYIDFIKKQQDGEDPCAFEAIKMLNNLYKATKASLFSDLTPWRQGIQVAVGSQYYKDEQELDKLISDFSDGKLRVLIRHTDNWYGDDSDASYIYYPIKDIEDVEELRRGFEYLKDIAPDLKMRVSITVHHNW